MNCFKTIVYSSESKKIGVRMGRASVQHILGDDFLDEELRRVKSDCSQQHYKLLHSWARGKDQ